MTVLDGSNAMPSSSTTRAVSAEWLAPVSSTRRNGPWPLTLTGAQMRPILSRRVGATKRGSSAVTAMSSSTTGARQRAPACRSFGQEIASGQRPPRTLRLPAGRSRASCDSVLSGEQFTWSSLRR